MPMPRRPRGRAHPTKGRDPALEKRILQIEHDHGLDRAVATQIALGRVELNEVLSRLAMQVEVDSLMRRHGLTRALATQVALKQADLKQVLFKRRMAEHLERNAERSILDEGVATGALLYFAAHGNRQLEAKVLSGTRYEVVLEEPGKPPETLHKLQFKFACAAADRKKIRRTVRIDKAQAEAASNPIWKPQERFSCSNRRLFTWMDEGTLVEATLLEGEVLRGVITWISRYEFCLSIKGAGEAVLFRHALQKLTEAT